MRRVLCGCFLQPQRHGRGQAAEAGIHQPVLAVQPHPDRQVGTRRQLAFGGRQQHARAQCMGIEAQCLQQHEEGAIELEAVAPALRVQQLALHAVQVDRHRIAQQAGEGLERHMGVLALLQQGQPGQGGRRRGRQLQALQVTGDIERGHDGTRQGRDTYCATATGVEVKGRAPMSSPRRLRPVQRPQVRPRWQFSKIVLKSR